MNGWFYRDPSGKVQGPFGTGEMRAWYEARFLPLTLPVHRSAKGAASAAGVVDAEFVSIQELYGDDPPFLLPPPAAPPDAVPVTDLPTANSGKNDCEDLLRDLAGLSLGDGGAGSGGTVVAAAPPTLAVSATIAAAAAGLSKCGATRAAKCREEVMLGRAVEGQQSWACFKEASGSRKPVSFSLVNSSKKGRSRRSGDATLQHASRVQSGSAVAGAATRQAASAAAAAAPAVVSRQAHRPREHLVVDTNELLSAGALLPGGGSRANELRQDAALRRALLQPPLPVTAAGNGGRLQAQLVHLPPPLIVLPLRVLRELDGLKRADGERGVAARRVVDALGRALATNVSSRGAAPGGTDTTKWLIGQQPQMRLAIDSRGPAATPDEEIVECACYFHARADRAMTLLTSDKHMLLLARAKGLAAKGLAQARIQWEEKNRVWRAAYAKQLAQDAMGAASSASGLRSRSSTPPPPTATTTTTTAPPSSPLAKIGDVE